MGYTRINKGILTGEWNSAGDQYTATWELTGTAGTITPVGQITTSDGYLRTSTGTIIERPASGYVSVPIDIYMKVAKSTNYAVSKRTLQSSTFADGEIEYFESDDEGDLYRIGCLGGEWASDSKSFSFVLGSDGSFGLWGEGNTITQRVSLTSGLYPSVTSVIFTCGLEVVESDSTSVYIFDGIATPNGTNTPTPGHSWSEYNTSTAPSIVYYGKSDTVTTAIPIRYELIATDNPADDITYTIPYLRDHFADILTDDITRIDAYKHSAKTTANYILGNPINTGSTLTTFTMTISDFSNGNTDGSTIYLGVGSQIARFFWDNNDGSLDNQLINSGIPITTGLTAANWTRLQQKCIEVQTAFGITPQVFTTVHTGDPILAAYYNEVWNALASLPAAAVPQLPPEISAGNHVMAYLFNGNLSATIVSLKHALNVAIVYYNDNM